MIKRLKYDFYQVVLPVDAVNDFAAILNQINALTGRDRLYTVGDHPVRLHSLTNGNAYLLGDIARIKMNDIPEKMKLSGETEPLELDDDEGLGEFASYLFHPVTNVLIMMRNRNSITISGFANYVEHFSGLQCIQFTHILQFEAYQRLNGLNVIQRVDLEVAAAGNATVFRDLGLAPEGALNLMLASPLVHLSLAFSTGHERERSLPRDIVQGIVTAFRNRRDRADRESISLVVSGRDETLQKEVIDLFEDVLTDSQDVNIRNQRTITDNQRHQATTTVWNRHRDRLIQLFEQHDE